MTDLERMAFQDSAREDDVFTTYAGATELAGTFIKEILVSSPTEIEIFWKFRDVFEGCTAKHESGVEIVCMNDELSAMDAGRLLRTMQAVRNKADL